MSRWEASLKWKTAGKYFREPLGSLGVDEFQVQLCSKEDKLFNVVLNNFDR